MQRIPASGRALCHEARKELAQRALLQENAKAAQMTLMLLGSRRWQHTLGPFSIGSSTTHCSIPLGAGVPGIPVPPNARSSARKQAVTITSVSENRRIKNVRMNGGKRWARGGMGERQVEKWGSWETQVNYANNCHTTVCVPVYVDDSTGTPRWPPRHVPLQVVSYLRHPSSSRKFRACIHNSR